MGIENAKFIYKSYKADVSIDTKYEIPGINPNYTIKINAKKNSPLTYAYQNGDGLVLIENKNKKRKNNILGEFLKIKANEDYLKFFSDYGFIFKIPFDRFTSINFDTIIKISNRLNALISLLNEINNEIPNYKKLFDLSISIFFDAGWKFETSDEKKASHNFKLADLIIKNAMDTIIENYDSQQAISTGYLCIQDTMFENYKFDFKEYQNIINGYSNEDGHDDYIFKAITYLYVNYQTSDKVEREIIDILFHFYHEIGIPKSIEFDNIQYFSRIHQNSINNYFVDNIYNFAKYIIKTEIDSNIADVHPIFNESTMTPDWNIDSLLSAMYLSLFFMDSKQQMMRECAYCGRLFVVKRTTDTKIYCDGYCRNNSQASKHRQRMKAQKNHQ